MAQIIFALLADLEASLKRTIPRFSNEATNASTTPGGTGLRLFRAHDQRRNAKRSIDVRHRCLERSMIMKM